MSIYQPCSICGQNHDTTGCPQPVFGVVIKPREPADEITALRAKLVEYMADNNVLRADLAAAKASADHWAEKYKASERTNEWQRKTNIKLAEATGELRAARAELERETKLADSYHKKWMRSDDEVDRLKLKIINPTKAAEAFLAKQPDMIPKTDVVSFIALVLMECDEKVERFMAFAKTCESDFDCDTDAHRYGTFCRACEAKKALAGKEASHAEKPSARLRCLNRQHTWNEADVGPVYDDGVMMCPNCLASANKLGGPAVIEVKEAS